MADLREQLQGGLADRYRLDRELGRGGMATVFLAHDLRHDRPVALKVLHPELAATLGPERFQREIKLTARLQHPHILPVFDSGETAGHLWYTMPYVKGESLRDRLSRESQLPIADATQLAQEVADALVYAHGQHIIHRDIKPGNILLSAGHALLADLGIARALNSSGVERLTETGIAVGTVAYMSPEQASGERQLDVRSDIYSLGCVLYEMLVGEPPYNGRTAQAILAKRCNDPVPSVRRLRPSVSPALEEVLLKALAPVPADRWGTAAEFRSELMRLHTASTSAPVAEAAAGHSQGNVLAGAGESGRAAVAEASAGAVHRSRLTTRISDLRRRRAIQIAIIYAGVAYVVVEGASVLLPALNAPPWMLTLLAVIAIFGVPVAAVLAWTFEPALVGEKDTAGRRGRPSARRVLLGLGLTTALLLAAGTTFLWRNHAAGTSHQSRGVAAFAPSTGPGEMLAVLPFENLGPIEDEYFADGVTDEVRGKLSALPGIRVIARGSSTEYKRTTKKLHQIGAELGVQYLLTATVRWQKHADGTNQVRVNPELVRIEPGSVPTTKWQQGFEAPLTDVFKVQADIAGQVAQALNVALGDSLEQELSTRTTQSLPAYDAFLRGEAASQGMTVIDPPSLRPAIVAYEQAVALDSTSIKAWAQLARAQALLYFNGTPSPAAANAARHAAERALSLDPTRPEGHQALGAYYAYVLADKARAYAADSTALALAPGNADLLWPVGFDEHTLGRWEAARGHLEQAARLDPRSAVTAHQLGYLLVCLRQYPEARRVLDHALRLLPANLLVRVDRAMVALATGDLAGAQAVLRAAPKEVDPTALVAFVGNNFDLVWVLDQAQQQLLLRLTPNAFNDRAQWAIVLAQTYALHGNTAKTRVYADSARSAFEQQLEGSPQDAQRHVFLGLALAYLGRKAAAIREGQRGMELLPISRDALVGPYIQHQLARIYLIVGEHERALDQLEPLLKVPYYLSPGWLRIDPTFDPLRGNPRFERLLNGT